MDRVDRLCAGWVTLVGVCLVDDRPIGSADRASPWIPGITVASDPWAPPAGIEAIAVAIARQTNTFKGFLITIPPSLIECPGMRTLFKCDFMSSKFLEKG